MRSFSIHIGFKILPSMMATKHRAFFAAWFFMPLIMRGFSLAQVPVFLRLWGCRTRKYFSSDQNIFWGSWSLSGWASNHSQNLSLWAQWYSSSSCPTACWNEFRLYFPWNELKFIKKTSSIHGWSRKFLCAFEVNDLSKEMNQMDEKGTRSSNQIYLEN